MRQRRVWTGLAAAWLLATPGRAACLAGEATLLDCGAATKVTLCAAEGRKPVARIGRASASFALRRAERMFSGGGETQIVFDSGDTSTILFSRTLRTTFGPNGQHDPQSDTGLLFQKHGRIIGSTACAAADTALDSPALKTLPETDYITH